MYQSIVVLHPIYLEVLSLLEIVRSASNVTQIWMILIMFVTKLGKKEGHICMHITHLVCKVKQILIRIGLVFCILQIWIQKKCKWIWNMPLLFLYFIPQNIDIWCRNLNNINIYYTNFWQKICIKILRSTLIHIQQTI